MKHYTQWLWILGCLLGLLACSDEPRLKEGRLLKIKPENFSHTLYYAGIIQPLKTVVVPSQVDGTIVEMPFQYGEWVESGQLLFVISSAKFLTDYKAALMQYIKAKSDFNTTEAQLSEAKFLHKNGLISDDDFKMKRSAYYSSQLSLLQAKDSLENLLHQLNLKDKDPYQLTIADIDKITDIIRTQASTKNNIRLSAPANGIVLAANKNEEESKKVTKGDVVKQGDVLAVIGDMSGLSVRIKVNELTINQLKLGQKVKISGIAFPDDSLEGAILRIDKQGEPSSAGLPTFSAEIVVPTLTPEQSNSLGERNW